MTISGAGTGATRARSAPRRCLVIIPLALAAAVSAAGADLTTKPAVPALAAVVVDGSTRYAAPQVFDAYRDQLGQPVSREAARRIVDALLALYQRDGWVRPQIELDDTLTGRGVIRVRVHEARISRVRVEGNAGRHRAQLEAIGARLVAAQPLRHDDVARALADMRRIAGLTISASTRRDPAQRHAVELVVRSEYSAVEGLVRMNNRGTEEIGPGFVLGQFAINGLLGGQEKLGLLFASAAEHDEYFGGGLFLDTAFAGGTRANLLLFKSHSAPREAPVDFAHEYQRERAALRLSRPLRDDSRGSLLLTVAFEAEDLFIERRGVRLREDRLRVFEAGLRGGHRGASASYTGSIAVRQGLDAFGAGLDAPFLSHDPRRPDFLSLLLSAGVQRRYATDWTARFDAFGQFSDDVLPDGERFKIGGDRLGRGFEVAEIAGDRGVGGKLELRRDLVRTDGLLGRLSAYGFYDFGAAWKQDRPGRESATTAGTGIAIHGTTLTGYLEVAAPLTGTDVEGKRDPSVFAELSYRF
jgi:hemolysin activation/secretion protein